MTSRYDIIVALLRTEKSSVQSEAGKYFFEVRKSANKVEIKKAVESIYKVKVKSVNTQVNPGKTKRLRYQAGMTPEKKKAVVTLQAGQKIELA